MLFFVGTDRRPVRVTVQLLVIVIGLFNCECFRIVFRNKGPLLEDRLTSATLLGKMIGIGFSCLFFSLDNLLATTSEVLLGHVGNRPVTGKPATVKPVKDLAHLVALKLF